MDTEEYDEWMLESISLYKDLHDFELQDPTRVIEWIGDKSICVAGYDSCKRNEILQLLVPQRLNAKQNQGLCPERDLKVEHGGFSDYPVYSLIRIPDSNLLLTSGPGTDKVQVWQIGAEDNDVIKPVSTVTSEAGSEMWTKLATTASTSPRVLHGSQANGVQLTEIESSKPIYTLGVTSSDAIGTLSFLDCNTFHLCCVNGRQYIADVRQPQVCAEGCVAPASLSSVQWCAAVKPGLPETSCHIASLSSEGHVTVTDSRDLSEPLKCAKLKFSDPAPTNHFLCVRWAPVLDNCISVSGLDGTVQIYDTQSWDATLQAQDAVFIHKGHSVLGTCNGAGSLPRITAHAWHPWKERIVLSAATDGSFHVWDWTDSQTKRQHNS
ncbi:WD repeat-containing protein 73 isoform X1 [Bombina bombina]|uniref:WD repeat-containing protein 73 isoform X1 n=1 Tax=Bombina bombina TaxID=8345 RepID=UPI00235B2EBC|nr:WD repeat-containing protein 73 isoform X1 [Bombina bombina]